MICDINYFSFHYIKFFDVGTYILSVSLPYGRVLCRPDRYVYGSDTLVYSASINSAISNLFDRWWIFVRDNTTYLPSLSDL